MIALGHSSVYTREGQENQQIWDTTMESGLTRLRGDLADGTWERRYGHLLGQSALDLGYRLVIAHGGVGGIT
jgi:hypothetical protein